MNQKVEASNRRYPEKLRIEAVKQVSDRGYDVVEATVRWRAFLGEYKLLGHFPLQAFLCLLSRRHR